jgi:hypothetical protein
MQRVTRSGIRDVKPSYTTLLPIAHDVPAVVDWLNLRLTANQLSSERRGRQGGAPDIRHQCLEQQQ